MLTAFSLHKREVNLRDLVRRVVASFEQRASEKAIMLLTELDDVVAYVDPDRLEQVLMNLLDNACKHTPNGGEVSVSLRRQGGHLSLSVQDSGQGFEVEPEALFRRFYTSADEEKTGTGLGLALVRALVHLHQGTVAAENCQNRGARFEVQLPLDVRPRHN